MAPRFQAVALVLVAGHLVEHTAAQAGWAVARSAPLVGYWAGCTALQAVAQVAYPAAYLVFLVGCVVSRAAANQGFLVPVELVAGIGQLAGYQSPVHRPVLLAAQRR